MLPFLSSKAERGDAIFTVILGQMLLLAAKTLEETLSGNKQEDCRGQGGSPGLHLIHQGSCPVQGEALPAALAVTPLSSGIYFCTVFQCVHMERSCRSPQGSPALNPTALMLHLKEPVPAMPLHRGLQQTPPEVPPSSAMCCRAPCIQTRGCTETCTRPCRSQSAQGGKPTKQVLLSEGRAGAAGEAATQCETNSRCCWQPPPTPSAERRVPRLWGPPILDYPPPYFLLINVTGPMLSQKGEDFHL